MILRLKNEDTIPIFESPTAHIRSVFQKVLIFIIYHFYNIYLNLISATSYSTTLHYYSAVQS